MKFDEPKLLQVLNEAWSWKVPEVITVLAVNSMANCFIKDCNANYWRICPEELSAEIVAYNEAELHDVFENKEFKGDWQLLGLIDPAEEQLGKLEPGKCYGMRIPAVIGGDYSVDNLRVMSIYEYLSASGSMAYQTKDAQQDDTVTINIIK